MQDNEIFKDGKLTKENLKVEVPFVPYLMNNVLGRLNLNRTKRNDINN